MQRVTHNLILGFNYTYKEGTSFLGYAVKYKLRSHRFYFQYSPEQSLNLAYSLPILDKMKFIANFAYEQNKTTTILGLRQKYINSEITATINSRGKLATNLILGGNGKFYSLRLCAIVDYLKETYKFGYGIIIGQN
jgi:mitochondrial import receptor subunit TOM40